ncbi:MAG: NADH-quinone oxidoreductase subunit NuoE [Alphaproteobacteria bacterium]|nr:NADH-quinone oxidoreductase subunit NuoE [Alphaproteobacteria bacterium]
MSVRRLAEDQPESFAFRPEAMPEVERQLAKFPSNRKASAVIPLLWLVQKQEGWVSEPAIRVLAEMLGMPKIRVLEVATFYTMFHLEPRGRHHLQVCGTTPCMLRGAEDLKAVCERRIGKKFVVSGDGAFSWEEVECLGGCVNAPVVAIDDYYHEDLSPDDLDALIDAMAKGETIKSGSALKRQTSAPEGGAQTLTSASLYDGSLAQKVDLPNRPQAGE